MLGLWTGLDTVTVRVDVGVMNKIEVTVRVRVSSHLGVVALVDAQAVDARWVRVRVTV